LKQQKDIKVYFYTDFNAYRTLNPKGAVEDVPELEIEPDITPWVDYMTPEQRKERNQKEANQIKEIIDYLESPDDPSQRAFFWNRAHYYDWIKSISADFHNARSEKGKPELQAQLLRLSNLMKRRKMGVEELVKNAQERSYIAFR
jgi:hypothetical protein